MEHMSEDEAWGFIGALCFCLLLGFLVGASYGKNFASDELKKELSKIGVECYDKNKTRILYFPEVN